MKGILATVLVMCMVGVSYADTLRGNRENCSHLGHVIRDIADARDNGALYEVVGPLTDAQIDDAMGKPGSIVNDKDDASTSEPPSRRFGASTRGCSLRKWASLFFWIA
jgi:hypothetical protein